MPPAHPDILLLGEVASELAARGCRIVLKGTCRMTHRGKPTSVAQQMLLSKVRRYRSLRFKARPEVPTVRYREQSFRVLQRLRKDPFVSLARQVAGRWPERVWMFRIGRAVYELSSTVLVMSPRLRWEVRRVVMATMTYVPGLPRDWPDYPELVQLFFWLEQQLCEVIFRRTRARELRWKGVNVATLYTAMLMEAKQLVNIWIGDQLFGSKSRLYQEQHKLRHNLAFGEEMQNSLVLRHVLPSSFRFASVLPTGIDLVDNALAERQHLDQGLSAYVPACCPNCRDTIAVDEGWVPTAAPVVVAEYPAVRKPSHSKARKAK